MSLLRDEIDWILANQHRYDGPMHARAVIGNIEKRYKSTAQVKSVERFACSPTTGNMFKMFEQFDGAEEMYLTGGKNVKHR